MGFKLAPVCLVYCLIALFEVEENIFFAPSIELVENAVCQKHFAALDPNRVPVNEACCKTSQIQSQLAYVRGGYGVFKTSPGQSFRPFLHPRDSFIHILVLLLGVSFGNLADKYGRRPMYALAMFGKLCFLAWTYLVCMWLGQ